MTASKRTMHTEWVGPDDAPELTGEFFEQADEYIGDRLVRRGRGRPVGSHKTATTIRLDDDVLKPSKQQGEAGRRA